MDQFDEAAPSMPKLALDAQNLRNEIEDAKAMLGEARIEIKDLERAIRETNKRHAIVYPILAPTYAKINKIRLAIMKLEEVLDDIYKPYC